MEIPYYPGCTLKTTAKNFEDTTIAVSKALDIELLELPRWNCCGTVYSLADDDLMHQLAPIRNLIRVQEMGYDKVTTLCSMCYNTLEQANQLVQNDPEKLEKMNAFMDSEEDYKGGITVIHYLTLLKEEIGFDNIPVKVPLNGLSVVPYYGCLLLRPEEVSIDNPEKPTIMAELLHVLGAEVVDHPYKLECCGSYHTVDYKEVVCEKTYSILDAAKKRGAEAVVLSCPLCEFNLDVRQKDVENLAPMPILYFSQLLAVSLQLDVALGFDQHYVNPEPLLKEKGLR